MSGCGFERLHRLRSSARLVSRALAVVRRYVLRVRRPLLGLKFGIEEVRCVKVGAAGSISLCHNSIADDHHDSTYLRNIAVWKGIWAVESMMPGLSSQTEDLNGPPSGWW